MGRESTSWGGPWWAIVGGRGQADEGDARGRREREEGGREMMEIPGTGLRIDKVRLCLKRRRMIDGGGRVWREMEGGMVEVKVKGE